MTEPPASGKVEMQLDGSFTYTPNPGFTGVVTFKYQVTDHPAGLTSNEATVTIDCHEEDVGARVTLLTATSLLIPPRLGSGKARENSPTPAMWR